MLIACSGWMQSSVSLSERVKVLLMNGKRHSGATEQRARLQAAGLMWMSFFCCGLQRRGCWAVRATDAVDARRR
jgi:hypothetical protein